LVKKGITGDKEKTGLTELLIDQKTEKYYVLAKEIFYSLKFYSFTGYSGKLKDYGETGNIYYIMIDKEIIGFINIKEKTRLMEKNALIKVLSKFYKKPIIINECMNYRLLVENDCEIILFSNSVYDIIFLLQDQQIKTSKNEILVAEKLPVSNLSRLREIISRRQENQKVAVTVYLDKVKISPDEISKIEVGDIIVLNKKVGDPIDAEINNIPKYRGQLINENGEWVYKVLETISTVNVPR